MLRLTVRVISIIGGEFMVSFEPRLYDSLGSRESGDFKPQRLVHVRDHSVSLCGVLDFVHSSTSA